MSSVDSHSVTNWIKAIKSHSADEQPANGQTLAAPENAETEQSPLTPEQAINELWDRYYKRLVETARKKSGDLPSADEEQAALDAMLSGFDFLAGEHEKAGRVKDRDELWRLLTTILQRKLGKQRRGQATAKRGSGKVRNASDASEANRPGGQLEFAIGREPPPEFQAIWDDLVGQLDPKLQLVTKLTLDGYTQLEIAKSLNCAPRTVKRHLDLIRATFRQYVSSDEPVSP